jgi:hypothetical protein
LEFLPGIQRNEIRYLIFRIWIYGVIRNFSQSCSNSKNTTKENQMSNQTETAGQHAGHLAAVPCCPPLTPMDVCDKLDFFFRLTHNVAIRANDRVASVPVEVKLHFRLTRCRGPLAIGDLLYTNTLLPGEKVKLFTSDRRTKFTFDSSSSLSYRNTQSSEESMYMQSMSDSVFDTNSRDDANSSNKSHSHVDGKADAGVDILGLGGSASMSGNFDADSTATFAAEHTAHAHSSHNATEQGVRKASSVSIGEVQSRSHAEGQSEDHFESASREFTNPNQCHAVTFLFYQINKTQTVKYTLEAIERRVILDPSNDFTKVALNPLAPSSPVGLTSVNVLATEAQKAAVAQTQIAQINTALFAGRFIGIPGATQVPPVDVRAAALKQVDQDLVKEGLLDKVGGNVSPAAKKKFSFEEKSALPTPGVLVKGCLDQCNICEPALQKSIHLDLIRKELENEKLKREIALMDKDQEHRCCPANEEETTPA